MAERLRVLVIGSGGREHALAWSLARSASVDVVHVCPGNGGTAVDDDSSPILNFDIAVDDFTALVAHARKHGLNLVIPGPEAPLVAGICAYFHTVGIRCFGPSKAAAKLEGSKAHAKEFMQKHSIPTAAFRSFAKYNEAKGYIEQAKHDVVIKADGLAAGKGVIIPKSKDEAQKALKEIMVDRQFGTAGDEVVIEELLQGEELSILSFSDGYTLKSLPPAQDHKRIHDGDKGPNTGGMGCYAPTDIATSSILSQIHEKILQPTIDGMRRQGTPFVGLLFTGLMLTSSGPKVIEYNVRFGDPEIQTLLPLLNPSTDLARIMVACTEHWLDGVSLDISPGYSATVVGCAQGYPGSYAKHRPIKFDSPPPSTYIFHAGTAVEKRNFLTTGGRVVAATATAPTLAEAIAHAYRGIRGVHFEGMHFRNDIGQRALVPTTTSLPSPPSTDPGPLTYSAAGVSISDGNTLVSLIKPLVAATARTGTRAELGGFGGLFDLSQLSYLPRDSPTLVGAIDGVGTKLLIAQATHSHTTIGIDCVAMNVNDLVVQGAEPLFFLDAFSTGRLDVAVARDVIAGVAQGCRLAGCALLGGETAEMPGLFPPGDPHTENGGYDLVGAAVGVVDTRGAGDPNGRKILPDTAAMKAGDILLGLASSGLHSNGFSLVRRVLEARRLTYTDPAPWSSTGESVGASLLVPTRIYVKSLLRAIQRGLVKGMAHITGGGLLENVPRCLPGRLSAEIDVGAWKRHGVFEWLSGQGVGAREMARTFNNGVGMVLVVGEGMGGEVKRVLEEGGEQVFRIGRLVERKEGGEGCVLLGLEGWGEDSEGKEK